MSEDIGIDLGTATVIAYKKDTGIILNEPSVVAINKYTKETIEIGKKAKEMIGRNPESIEVIKPLQDGVISNFTITSRMLKYYIKKVMGNSIFAPQIMICIPSQVTDVEKRAVIDVAIESGAKKVYLIEEPLAAAIGIGIDIMKSTGNIIVDIGGGTTDIAVISKGTVIANSSIRIAGNYFDREIIRYILKKYRLHIGEQEAERIKIDIGSAYPRGFEVKTIATGKNMLTGLPSQVEVTANEIMNVLIPPINEIIYEAKTVLEKVPPEIIEAVKENGIYITGGGSLLFGIDNLFTELSGIVSVVPPDSINSVAKGTGIAIDMIDEIGEDITTKTFNNPV